MFCTKTRMPRLSHSVIVKYILSPSLTQQSINIQFVCHLKSSKKRCSSNESTNINYFLYFIEKSHDTQQQITRCTFILIFKLTLRLFIIIFIHFPTFYISISTYIQNMNLKREMKLSNSELVTGCIKNSRVHQKALYDKFSTTMYSILFRMFNDREHANDVLQDAFITIFQTIINLNDPERLAGWIRTIIVRTAIQKMRERSRITFAEYTEIHDVILPDYDFTAIQLDEAIRSLPKGNRLVFMLIEIEGYRHKEVAEILNISEGTSKSQLNYAKKLLRKSLNEYTSEYAKKK